MKVEKAQRYFCIAFHGDLPEEVLAALAEAFLRFTPDLAVRGLGAKGGRSAIFMEVSRCLSLYSEASLELRVRRILTEWKIPSERVTIARSSNLTRAWLLASHRVGRPGVGEGAVNRVDRAANQAGRAETGREDLAVDRLPISAIEDAIDPLGLRARARPEERAKIRAMIEVLFLLGIRTLGSMRKLPPDSAISRFGELYEIALENLEEGTSARSAWERFRPLEKMSERVDLDPAETIWEIEPVLFEAKALLDRILRRCAGRGKAIAKLELRIESESRRNVRENWSTVRVDFTFPQTAALMILRMLREKLAHEFNTKPLDAPIVALEIEAGELAPRRSLQSNFFDTEESRLENAREAWRDLVTILSTKLQPSREVFQAELVPVWRPEKSWQRVLKDPEKVRAIALPMPERPLQILTPPEELRRLGRYLFWREERMKIKSLKRFERLSGEWWENEGGFARTYYRVRASHETEEPKSERDLWIFREQGAEGEKGGLFLHGIF